MRNLKKKKYSCFPKQQLLVENFRGFMERERLKEEIDRIINYHEQRLLSEGKLNEGMMQGLFRMGKKYGLDKLMVIAALSTMMAGSPAQAGFLEDVEKQVQDKIEMVQDAAQDIKSHLEKKGIHLETNPEGDPVFNYGEKSTVGDYIKEQIPKIETIKQIAEEDMGDGPVIIYNTNIGLIVAASMDKQEFNKSPTAEESNARGAAKAFLADYLAKDKTVTTDDEGATTTRSEFKGNLPTKHVGIVFTEAGPDNNHVEWEGGGEAYYVLRVIDMDMPGLPSGLGQIPAPLGGN